MDLPFQRQLFFGCSVSDDGNESLPVVPMPAIITVLKYFSLFTSYYSLFTSSFTI